MHGFDIGYTGPQNRQSNSKNLPFHVGDKVDLWNKLIKEVRLKRVAGPFKSIPYEYFIQSLNLLPHLTHIHQQNGVPLSTMISIKLLRSVHRSGKLNRNGQILVWIHAGISTFFLARQT